AGGQAGAHLAAAGNGAAGADRNPVNAVSPSGSSAYAAAANAAASSPANTQHVDTTAVTSADPNAAQTALAAAASQQAAPLAQTAAATTAGAAATELAIGPRVGTPDWSDALSQKVVFLSNAHQQSAALTLNPPDLGPLQVVLNVADNHAHALFVSQHPQVREAVEAALPKLREAMEAGGLSLGSANVSDGGAGFARQDAQRQASDASATRRAGGAFGAGGTGEDALAGIAATASSGATQRRVGIVDTFA
ncbi:flagellar hook-length control protein FliK, partial [Burkholderia glumae]